MTKHFYDDEKTAEKNLKSKLLLFVTSIYRPRLQNNVKTLNQGFCQAICCQVKLFICFSVFLEDMIEV